ncbi:MAG: GWxTD domain-containing protein, partial [Cyclobacteriaceae bacterium]|nr:GWxTD domain-containing protein [Cyclobacteriaceae bacterium]
MRRITLLLFLITTTIAGYGQSVSSINFNYWYNLQGEVTVDLRPVRQRDSIAVFYELTTTTKNQTSYTLQWEKRDSYNQRMGGIILPADSVVLQNGKVKGSFRFAKPEKPWLLAVKVTNPNTGKNWYFFKQIEAHYPVNGYQEQGGEKRWRSYISSAGSYTVRGSGFGKPIHFSYYKDNFPTPSPPFADKELKMDRFLFPDSTFSITPGNTIGPFKKPGLYLGQEDTLSAEGFSFLVMNDPYPRYNKLGDLKGPLLFVTTREENDKIGLAGEDKAKFDKVVLEITGDKERAKNFMRNYFKRVEFANYFFTSYKEGWKTDRGMIFMVFGAPDEVLVNGQQEIWGY